MFSLKTFLIIMFLYIVTFLIVMLLFLLSIITINYLAINKIMRANGLFSQSKKPLGSYYPFYPKYRLENTGHGQHL
jgi:hypothetical protein